MVTGGKLLAAGDIVAGRYRIEGPLGEGGMAVVFKARHTGTDRQCGLKFIQPHLAVKQKTVELFLKEAKVAGRIGSHPHIVDVLDSGLDQERGLPFIAMELLKGQTLEELLKQHGPMCGRWASSRLSCSQGSARATIGTSTPTPA